METVNFTKEGDIYKFEYTAESDMYLWQIELSALTNYPIQVFTRIDNTMQYRVYCDIQDSYKTVFEFFENMPSGTQVKIVCPVAVSKAGYLKSA